MGRERTVKTCRYFAHLEPCTLGRYFILSTCHESLCLFFAWVSMLCSHICACVWNKVMYTCVHALTETRGHPQVSNVGMPPTSFEVGSLIDLELTN